MDEKIIKQSQKIDQLLLQYYTEKNTALKVELIKEKETIEKMLIEGGYIK
jgi:hypothetical protein